MRLLYALAVLLLVPTGEPGNPETTLHFDQFEQSGMGFVIHSNPLDVGDYRFTSVDVSPTPLLLTVQQGSSFYNGSAALASGNGSDIRPERVDGRAFDALSVDLDSWPGQDTIELTSELSSGGAVQIDNLMLAFSVELRDAELVAGGSAVLQNGSGTVRLEDARLGRLGPPEIVPEPGALWQLGSGIGLLALLARCRSARRRRP